MDACSFSEFMETLKPWLHKDYIHRATWDQNGRCVLFFSDGGYRTFQIDGCTPSQTERTLALMRKNGIRVDDTSQP